MFHLVVVMTGWCVQDALIEEEISKAGCLYRSWHMLMSLMLQCVFMCDYTGETDMCVLSVGPP